MTRQLITVTSLLLVLTVPAVARADGLPILGYEVANSSITSAGGAFRYVTHVRRGYTSLVKQSRGGHTIRTAHIPGRLVVPVVAYDGSSSGLSYDRHTLALIRSRIGFPQTHTSLAIVDPATLAIRRRIQLRGDFSFDAISPSGRWVYLIQYTSRTDPTHYRVRSFDTRSGRLQPGAIVDPRNRGEAMRGNPLTRTTSADGRFAYTLYDGNGHPFVHALDTARRTARCIDVPPFPSTVDPFGTKLVPSRNQNRLLVSARGRTLATIDTRALALIRPAVNRRALARSHRNRSGTGSGMLGIAAALAAAAAAIGLLAARYGASRSISHRPPAASA